jgi:nitrate/nitrite transport system substrate-binding protein
MRRWGQITDARSDEWYHEIAEKVYRPDIYLQAAQHLIDEGLARPEDFPFDADGYRKPQTEFIDGIVFDGRKPNDYLEQFPIGLKGSDRVEGLQVISALR